MRLVLAILAFAALCPPGAAGEPYKPVKLKPAELVTPPPELIEMATRLLKAVEKGDGDAIEAVIADRVTTVDGGLELQVPRHKEVIGPFESTEDKLKALGFSTGGDLPIAVDGSDTSSYAITAEREFIAQSLTDGRPWGTDPMLKGAICSYAYRSFDIAAVKALSAKLDAASSGLVYVLQPYQLLKAPDSKAEPVATLEPDRLYMLDYDTDAPIKWIAVHLPEGGSGFANIDVAGLDKPYASGICFSKGKDGNWQMTGQASTSL